MFLKTMQTTLDSKTRFNGWLKFIIASFLTLFLSIGGSLLTSAKMNGIQEAKIEQFGKDINELKTEKQTDHDLLIKIAEKVDNIEKLLKNK